MKRQWPVIITVFGCCYTLCFCAGAAFGGQKAPRPGDGRKPLVTRREVVEALLKRSRLLEDVHFRVPQTLWIDYQRFLLGPPAGPAAAPVDCIAAKGIYRLAVEKDRAVTLEAEIHLRVFRPAKLRPLGVLTAELAWTDIRAAVNGKKPQPVSLASSDGWMRYTAAAAGTHVISARAKLDTQIAGNLSLPIPRTAQTLVAFDSPLVLHVTDPSAPQSITGAAGKGTGGVLALVPGCRLNVTYRRPVVLTEREATYQVRGAVAWNLDAGGQDVTAGLDVAILAGRTDRLEVTLPAGADRASVTGPDVREVRVDLAPGAGGTATVHLRGRITGRTALTVKFALPAARGHASALTGLGVRNGRWAGGTLVVTNSAGSSEIMPAETAGLKELALADIPRSAAGILTGRTALAYAITGRAWRAGVDVVDLGEFALRETIADLAHYEIVYRGDGSVICKADYEVRNRNRQFLRVSLPAGSKVLLARVNETSRPITPVGRTGDEYLLPLVRSKTSVIGLVSFPVEIVYVCRAAPMKAKGLAALELPRIDVPVAYAWAEAYLPEAMSVSGWGGPMKRVDRYSSETAVASMSYGRSELAEGYKREGRFKPVTAPPATTQPTTRPADPDRPAAKPQKGPPVKIRLPAGKSVVLGGLSLGRNYYRTGRDLYERKDFAGAQRALEQAMRLAPKSREADNAKRLLANIKLARGKFTLLTRGQKASGLQVLQGIQEGNRLLLGGQKQILERGFEAIRKGDRDKALTQFQAAEALSKLLVGQGEKQSEQDAVLRQARIAIAGAQREQKSQTDDYLRQIKTLRDKGKFAEALNLADRALKDTDGDGPADSPLLQRQLQQLAVLQAGKEARRHRFKADEGGQTGGREGPQLPPKPMRQDKRLRRPDDVDERDPKARLAALLEAQRREVVRYTAEGKRRLGSHDPERALIAFDQALVLDPDNAEAKRLRDQSRRAVEVIRRAAIIDQTSTRRRIQKQIDDLRLDKAPQRGGELADTARTKEDFNAAAEQIRLARERLARSEGLYSLEELRDKRAVIEAREARFRSRLVKWQESQAAMKRGELEEAKRRRPERMEREKRRKLETLTNRARALIRKGRYKQANEELTRIIAIDPGNNWALSQKETLTNFITLIDEKGVSEDGMYQPQQALVDIRRSEIPWWEMVRYPSDWKELALRRKRYAVGATAESKADRETRHRLRQKLPKLDFANVPLELVIQYLREVSGQSLYVNWRALQVASVDKSTEVNVHLVDVTVEEALKVILDDVSGAAIGSPTQVDFGTADGIVNITTREALSHRTSTRVIDIRDLLADIPVTGQLFEDAGRKRRKRRDGRGGGIGGGGVIGGGLAQTPGQYVGNEITELLKDTVARDTWDQEAGLRVVNGKLVLTQTEENHEAVMHLLNQLRKARGLNVDKGPATGRATRTRPKGPLHQRLAQSLPKLDLASVPFELALQFLREVGGVKIAVDWDALKVASVDKTTEVNVHLADVSLEKSLRVMLEDVSGASVGSPTEVTFVVSGDTVRITTAEALSHERSKQTYDIRDILAAVPAARGEDLAEDIVETIRESVARDTWDDEETSVRAVNGRLVVSQSATGHEAIAALLDNFRSARAPDQSRRDKPQPDRDKDGDAANAEVRHRLAQVMPKLDFPEVPFELVIQFLREVSGLTIYVNWRALQVANVEKSTEVNFPGTDVTAGAALQAILKDVSGKNVGSSSEIDFIIDNGVIRITTVEAMSHRTYVRVYDLRDLVRLLPGESTGKIEGDNASKQSVQTRDEFMNEAIELVKESVARDTWEQEAAIRPIGGQLVITQSARAHEAIEALVKKLRTIRRSQVQEGRSLSLQRAKDDTKRGERDADKGRLAGDQEFRRFLDLNYAWQRQAGYAQGQGQGQQGGQIDAGTISERLRQNWGQKVQVGSINIDATADAAKSLGLRFRTGNNDVTYTTIDEAQFRTLMEIDARNRAGGGQATVAPNRQRQDTIVGTDALLANDWAGNVTYSADAGNTIDILDNPVNLRHEDYILIDNDGYLTAVRAGQMQHWRDRAEAIEFVETPQDIDVPRAGRLVRFEKTLIRPDDRLVLTGTYTRERK